MNMEVVKKRSFIYRRSNLKATTRPSGRPAFIKYKLQLKPLTATDIRRFIRYFMKQEHTVIDSVEREFERAECHTLIKALVIFIVMTSVSKYPGFRKICVRDD